MSLHKRPALDIKVVFRPRKTTISGSPDAIQSLLVYAAHGAKDMAADYPNATPLNTQYGDSADICRNAAYMIEDCQLRYQRERGER